jgi:hypothetical protein
MKTLINTIASLAIVLSLVGTAGAISNNAGTGSGEFLRLPAGAKPAGMGEAYTALADDVYAIYFNPAGLARVTQQEALLAHTMYFMDVNHDYVAYARPFMKGGIGASVTYLSTTFEKRSEANYTDTPDSNGTVADMALSLAYGRSLLWGINGGLALKYISSSLDGTNAATPAADIGLQKAVTDKIEVGLAVTNLGGALKYITDTVALENTIDLGVAEKGILAKDLTIAVDYKTLMNMSGQTVNLGAEYQFNVGKAWSIDPRAGYISHNGTMTAGFGIAYNMYQFDYAFNTQNDLGTSNRISFTVKF